MADNPAAGAPGAPVPARVRMADTNELLLRYLENPELGGIVIPTHVDVPIGTKLDLTIDFGNGNGIRAICQVMWFREAAGAVGAGVGVRFVQMGQAHREWLAAALKAMAPKAEPSGDERHLLRKAESAKELEGAYEDLSQYDAEAGGQGAIMGIDLGTCNCSACVF